MITFRLLALDAARKTQAVKDIEGADDADAIAQTKQLVDGHDVELWEHGGRFVEFFKTQKKKPLPNKAVELGIVIPIEVLAVLEGR